LPLPVCAHPAMLRSARITAVPSAIFFTGAPNRAGKKTQNRNGNRASLVQKRHTPHLIYRREFAPGHRVPETAYRAR